MAFIPPIGSTVAFQSDPTKLVGTVSVVGNMNSSVTAFQGTSPWIVNQPSPSIVAYQAAGSILAVSGSFSASPQSSINALQLAGSVLAVRTDNASVVAVLSNSSVAVLQGTNPWQINVPSPSTIAYQLAGSIMAVSATVNTGNSSVQLLGGVAAIGSVATLQGTNPWIVQAIGSVAVAVNSTNTSIFAVLTDGVDRLDFYEENQVDASTVGIAHMFKSNVSTSIMTVVSPANPLPVSVQGTVAISNPNSSVMLTASTNHSVIAVLSNSSVAALQGTNPWLIGNSSVLALQGTLPWVIQSIVGTYAEDSGHTTGDKGLLAFGVRNDTVASLVNADLDYGAWAQDSAGRHIIKPFAANEASIFAHASVVNGGDSGSVLVLAAAGAGLRNYVTDWNVSNTGSVATLITFTEGGGSIIGRTIAPAGGGSNMPGMNSPMRNNLANQPINMVTATAASVVYVAMYGHKAP